MTDPAPTPVTEVEALPPTTTETVASSADIPATYHQSLLANGFDEGQAWWLTQQFMARLTPQAPVPLAFLWQVRGSHL